MLGRILGGNNEERQWQPARVSLHCYLLFGHRLKQCRLSFWRCPVYLVGKHDIRKDRAGFPLEFVALLVEYRKPDNVGGKKVGRELYALERKLESSGESVRKRRFADPGNILDQKVASREKGRQRK